MRERMLMETYLIIAACTILAWLIVLACGVGVGLRLKQIVRDAGGIARIHRLEDFYAKYRPVVHHKRRAAK